MTDNFKTLNFRIVLRLLIKIANKDPYVNSVPEHAHSMVLR